MADDGWNTVPISKGNRPIDTSRLTKITKVRLEVQHGQLRQLPGWDLALLWGSELTRLSACSLDPLTPTTSSLHRVGG